VETIDLADSLSPVPYSKVAPREHRKLHNLHESVQKNESDASVRLPKRKPQFSYASGAEPDLPFLRNSQSGKEDGMFDAEVSDDDLPSPSNMAAFLKGDSDDPFKSGSITYNEPTPTSFGQDDSLESLEAGMLALEEPVQSRVSTPKVDASFANGVFDFDAFDDEYGEAIQYSSPLMRDSRKRERSRSPTLPKTKHRRVAKEPLVEEPKTTPPIKSSDPESYTMSDVPEIESKGIKKQEPTQSNTQQAVDERRVPDWVGEFDSELIDSLMGIVDFIE
jgi:ATP-dependent DNA helicase HFM1/MER3